MIATRTPFRITLGGGGTDLPSFYERHGGQVLALGIDKYMYVVVNVPHADRLIRLHYTRSETVAHTDDLQHELAREALRKHGIFERLEVASVADLPAGAGLGSSSAYLVGLLTALRAYTRAPVTRNELAEEACDIELIRLRKPVGKQDQYMAVYGGLTELRIAQNGAVTAEAIELPPHLLSELTSQTHLYFTHTLRESSSILRKQDDAMKLSDPGGVAESLCEIAEIGRLIGRAIRECDFDQFGCLMHRHWTVKRRLSREISLPGVDALYEEVRRQFGVLGGKLVGAGGGGFLMLYCPGDGRALTEFMQSQGMPRLPYQAELEGSRVLTHTLKAFPLREHGRPRAGEV